MQLDALLTKIGVRERVAAAVAISILIVYLDFQTAATLVSAVMYIPVAGLLYGVRRASVYFGFAAICTICSAITSLTDVHESDFDNMMINRGMSAVVLYAICFLIYRNSQSAHVLRRLATTDSLTGAYNRRHFMDLMAREQRRAERYNVVYSVLMIDIDHFKQVNDTFGHQIGDLAIQAMAEACKKAVRPTDIVARYGGEEFIVTLTHTDRAGALRVAERVRGAVSEVVLTTPQGELRFTISIGVGTYTKQSVLDQIIGAADAALYKAKTSGRNRVCADGEPDAAPALA
jgi:diguanylate cyclase (GGDEF)-like protein